VSEIAKSEEQQPVKRMNVNLPVELHNRFKSITAAQGQNMTDVLIQYIEEYVDRYSVKPKGRRK
jgi:hypothetical protein